MTTRREFMRYSSLAGVAAAGSGYWTSSSAQAIPATRWVNEQLQFAHIGVGGKGRSDSEQAAAHGVVTAICDCDTRMLDAIAKTLQAGAEVKLYADPPNAVRDTVLRNADVLRQSGFHVRPDRPN